MNPNLDACMHDEYESLQIPFHMHQAPVYGLQVYLHLTSLTVPFSPSDYHYAKIVVITCTTYYS